MAKRTKKSEESSKEQDNEVVSDLAEAFESSKIEYVDSDDTNSYATRKALALILVILMASAAVGFAYYKYGTTKHVITTPSGNILKVKKKPELLPTAETKVVAPEIVKDLSTSYTDGSLSDRDFSCLIISPSYTEEVAKQVAELDCEVITMPLLPPTYCAQIIGGCVQADFLK